MDIETSRQQAALDRNQLKLLTELFPIGKELRYYSDAQLAVVLDTLIVAYRVNERFIYSRNAIKMTGNGSPAAFAIEPEKIELPLEQAQHFQILVPDTTDMEGTLDYDRRAIIGRSQFKPGNIINLICNSGAKGASTLKTQVAEQITMADGPYANSKMVLLNPEFDSISVTDQLSASRRGRTNVPVDMYFKKDEPPYKCLLSDFSESSVGLHAIENQPAMPPLLQDDVVTIVIDLGESAKTYTIKGRVIRRSADICAVRLDELFRDHEYSRFTLLDSLKLKAGLLNYGI